MNIGPLGAVGAPLAQTKGPGAERAHGQLAAERRRLDHLQKAELAAGIAPPDGEDHQSAGSHADGRRPWEQPPSPADPPAPPPPRSQDPSQQSGNLLDLDG
jgi:hypothetical protein